MAAVFLAQIDNGTLTFSGLIFICMIYATKFRNDANIAKPFITEFGLISSL